MATTTTVDNTIASAPLQLLIEPPQGVPPFALTTSPHATVLSVMESIAERTHIPADKQLLIHQGHHLHVRHQTLAELHITDGARLVVTPQLAGGCACCQCCTVL